jgi:hypothetical protein
MLLALNPPRWSHAAGGRQCGHAALVKPVRDAGVRVPHAEPLGEQPVCHVAVGRRVVAAGP